MPTRPIPSLVASLALVALAAFAAPLARGGEEPAARPAGEIPADTEIVTTASGLKYSVLTAGKPGPHPQRGARVKVHYTGWLTDGTKFDSSRDRGVPADFAIGQLVEGWNEALCLMTAGARWKLTIPPALGYRERGSPPTIPPNATLVFELELIDFQALPEFHPADPAKQTATASGIKVETVVEGAGATPDDGDNLDVKFALWNAKGELLDCSERGMGSIKIRRDNAPLKFMKDVLGMFRVGARLRFEVPPALCFGEADQGPQLPPNSVTIWELELVGVKKQLPMPEFPPLDETKLVATKSGLKYEILVPGEGESPKERTKVRVHYAGWLSDGKLFDSSFQRGEEAEFMVGGVIAGWNEGLQLMKPGSVYRFVIPPMLAYGARAQGDRIPANSTLTFVIQLVAVVK